MLSQAPWSQRPDSHPVAYRGDAVLTSAALRAQVAALAAELSARPEQRWALVCRDAYYFVCAFLAVLHSNKQLVIPPNFQSGTLAALQGEVDAWIADDATAVPFVHHIVVVTSASASDGKTFSLSIRDDAIVDLFTSGTTGTPKRVRKRFAQLTAEVEVLESLWGAQLASAAIVATVPHHHIYGLLFRLLWPLAAGRPFDVNPCGNPNELVERLHKLGPAGVISSPAQLGRLPALTDPGALAPQARRIFSSGGPLPTNAAQAFAQALGEAPTEVFGSSETGGIAWRVQSDVPDGSAWTPLPRVDVQRSGEGALQVRSPFIGSDDWFTTADSVEFLRDGRFQLRGRLDRVVKIEEKRLSLAELEERLCRHPWVAEAGAVLLDGARRVLGAVLTLTPEGQVSFEKQGKVAVVTELRRFLAQYYEPPLLPRQWRFPPSLPQNDRGKVSSQALAALFAQAEQRDI